MDESTRNFKLIERYPFLMPDKYRKNIIDRFDYSYTLLDNMPTGWRIAFGERLCEELRNELIKENLLDDYYILVIKEKHGRLRWYGSYGSDAIDDILAKYEYISEYVCVNCGSPNARMQDDGWLSPYCKSCWKKEYVDSEGIEDAATIVEFKHGDYHERKIPVKDTWNAIVEDYERRMNERDR